jgi:hypothetical protein
LRITDEILQTISGTYELMTYSVVKAQLFFCEVSGQNMILPLDCEEKLKNEKERMGGYSTVYRGKSYC